MQLKAYQCPRCHQKYNIGLLESTNEIGYKNLTSHQFYFCHNFDGRVICPDCDQEGHGYVELELLLESVSPSPALALMSSMSLLSLQR